MAVKLSGFKTQNIVASCDMRFSIKLEALLEELQKYSRCHYEPELFPGLIYKMEKPKVVLLIFTSGKINLAGAKTKQQIEDAFQKIYPVLFKYNKERVEAERKKKLQASAVSKPKMLSAVDKAFGNALGISRRTIGGGDGTRGVVDSLFKR